jgi:glycosyltransferase involved in cell wall biosynthesis
LVHGFKLALSRNENLELLLAGPDGGHEQYLRSLVKSLGIENKVHFLGLLDPEKRRMFFSFTDLFILAGYSGENFGVSAVEAMASGIPVIVSGHVCIYPDIVKNGAGIQVQVSKDEISEAIIKIFSDPELIKEMGEAAYRTARKFYEKTRTSQLMMLAYKDILLGKRSSECNWSN